MKSKKSVTVLVADFVSIEHWDLHYFHVAVGSFEFLCVPADRVIFIRGPATGHNQKLDRHS